MRKPVFIDNHRDRQAVPVVLWSANPSHNFGNKTTSLKLTAKASTSEISPNADADGTSTKTKTPYKNGENSTMPVVSTSTADMTIQKRERKPLLPAFHNIVSVLKIVISDSHVEKMGRGALNFVTPEVPQTQPERRLRRTENT